MVMKTAKEIAEIIGWLFVIMIIGEGTLRSSLDMLIPLREYSVKVH